MKKNDRKSARTAQSLAARSLKAVSGGDWTWTRVADDANDPTWGGPTGAGPTTNDTDWW